MTGFETAKKTQAKIKMAIEGPSGSGKTLSALLIAGGLAKGDWASVGVVDTENGSAQLYVGKTIDGQKIGPYKVLTMKAPFDPKKYVTAIQLAEEAGIKVLIIDSLSHAWTFCLDEQSKIASRTNNSFSAWRTITPMYQGLLDAMLQANMHVITTMRSKVDYSMDGGKVKKLGMAPVARADTEYEYTIVLDMDQQHNAQASKDRTGLFDQQLFKPTMATGTTILKWLEA